MPEDRTITRAEVKAAIAATQTPRPTISIEHRYGEDWVTIGNGPERRVVPDVGAEVKWAAGPGPESWGLRAERFGRVVRVEIGNDVDECDQFRVAISVDGKTHWEAWITNKSDYLSGEGAADA